MHTLGTVLVVGIVGVVFGLALATFGGIAMTLLYAQVRDARGFLLGWRSLICPAFHTAEEVRVRRVAPRAEHRVAIVSCSRFGGQRPSCDQACLSIVGPAAA